MGKRLTDAEKKQIVAEYTECGSLRVVAKKHNIAPNTVKNICNKMHDFEQICKQKKEQNAADILEYMNQNKDKVITIMDKYLDVLADDEKIEAATLNQITTSLGTLIDKWTFVRDQQEQESRSGVVILSPVLPPNTPPEVQDE